MCNFVPDLQQIGRPKTISLDIIHQWDDESLVLLYRHFYKALTAYSCQIVNDLEVAEDIVQDTFFSTWDKKNSYSSLGALKAYLYNTVRNNSINHMRHQQVTQNHVMRLQQEYKEMHTDENGELRQHKEELYRQLFRAIDEMPPKQREVFLQIMEGKKNHEIAEAMEMSINTVKKIRQRGIAKLRGELNPDAFAIFITLIP